ncbi:MAG: ATP-binding cassette domain-containing protein [Labilithrix sp.]|nr:ATP-binding cassette domain-containing protein [Labilithrix sp.]
MFPEQTKQTRIFSAVTPRTLPQAAAGSERTTAELCRTTTSRSNSRTSVDAEGRRHAVLTAHAVTKAYGLRPLFDNATFTIRRGEKVALLGPNGTGKSTLLRVLARIEPLARILVAKPDLAIFDEPTNHLDAETIGWLEQYMLTELTGAVLFVTHDRYLLDHVASRVFDLEDGRVAEYTKRNDAVGAFEDFLEQKAERFAHAERVESNRQNFLRMEIEWLRRGPKAPFCTPNPCLHGAACINSMCMCPPPYYGAFCEFDGGGIH